MQKLRSWAAQFGLGIGAAYGFFLLPSIADLFQPAFLILLRQVLSIAFAVCLLFNPQQIIELGAKYLPKILQIFQVLNTKDKKDES